MKPAKKLPVTISILTLMSLTLMACNGTGATDSVTQQTAATATQPSTGSNESLHPMQARKLPNVPIRIIKGTQLRSPHRRIASYFPGKPSVICWHWTLKLSVPI